MKTKTTFQPRTVGLLVTVLLAAGLFSSCGPRSSEVHDRLFSELDCPVVLVAKTDKAAHWPSVVVRDGAGRVRTFAADRSDYVKADAWRMSSAIAESREVGDTLKPCPSPCR
jgi:hypothetical protein